MAEQDAMNKNVRVSKNNLIMIYPEFFSKVMFPSLKSSGILIKRQIDQFRYSSVFEVCMRFFGFLIAILILSQVQAATQIAAGDPNAVQGGTLTYEAYEADTINPITYKQIGATEILVNWVMETLLDNDMATGEYIPRLAKKWEIGKDGKTFTFWAYVS